MGYPWGTYLSENPFVAYGKLWTMGFDGYLYAIDIGTGKAVWKFFSGSSGYETPYGTYPLWNGPLIADGVVFAGTGEHSPTQPLIRGEKLFAVDANTGKELWEITGLMHTDAIAEGYLVGYNAYDNRIYCFGKGPSDITVQAPLTAVPSGSGVTITGSVTDQSTGQKDSPAISDADMSGWMEYLYMQKSMPMNAKGVEVKMTAVDPNGQTSVIGTTTSDLGGSYGISWTPTVQGKYQITATFAGSDSYGSSFATTYMTVGSASASPSFSTAPNTGSNIGTEVYILLAAVAVIAVVIAASVIVLRRRK